MLQQQIESLNRQSMLSNGSGNRESLSPEAAAISLGRNGSSSSQQARKANVPSALPTPPPSIPLPPLPNSPTTANPQIPNDIDGRGNSPPLSRTTSPPPNYSPPGSRQANEGLSCSHTTTRRTRVSHSHDREANLFAEKQLTATLEEALVDLETSANRTKAEMDNYRKKCTSLEEELSSLKKERTQLPRESAGRGRRTRDESACRKGSHRPRGAHERAQQHQEKEEEFAELLLDPPSFSYDDRIRICILRRSIRGSFSLRLHHGEGLRR